MAKKKKYNDDDGRTIADMSGISKTPLIIPKPFDRHDDVEVNDAEREAQKPEHQINLSKGERRSFIFGALSASLLIGLVFVLAFAAVILVIYFFGK